MGWVAFQGLFVVVVEFVVGLDVDEDVGDLWLGFAEGFADGVGDVVAFADGERGVHADVEVHIEIEAHFAKAALIERADAGDFGGDGADLIFEGLGRCGVHRFVERGAQEHDAIPCDEAARELRVLLDQSPDSPFRPLAREYLELVTGESQPALPPDENVPVLMDDGTGDPEAEVPAAVKPAAK